MVNNESVDKSIQIEPDVDSIDYDLQNNTFKPTMLKITNKRNVDVILTVNVMYKKGGQCFGTASKIELEPNQYTNHRLRWKIHDDNYILSIYDVKYGKTIKQIKINVSGADVEKKLESQKNEENKTKKSSGTKEEIIAQNMMKKIQEKLETEISEAKSRLSLNKVRELLDSISKEVGGNWYDNAKKNMPMLSDNSPKQANKSANYTLDGFKKLIDELVIAVSESEKPPDSDIRKVLQSIGRDVVPSVVEAVDQKKSAGININPSVEKKLSELIELTEVREMDIKVGERYDSQIHDLVADDDPNKRTDSNQKITKVLFRGLLLPGGGHIKPRVSIRK